MSDNGKVCGFEWTADTRNHVCNKKVTGPNDAHEGAHRCAICGRESWFGE